MCSAGGEYVEWSHLAKLLKAADCGLIHKGTLLPWCLSVMNVCNASEIYKMGKKNAIVNRKVLHFKCQKKKREKV